MKTAIILSSQRLCYKFLWQKFCSTFPYTFLLCRLAATVDTGRHWHPEQALGRPRDLAPNQVTNFFAHFSEARVGDDFTAAFGCLWRGDPDQVPRGRPQARQGGQGSRGFCRTPGERRDVFPPRDAPRRPGQADACAGARCGQCTATASWALAMPRARCQQRFRRMAQGNGPRSQTRHPSKKCFNAVD